MLVFSALTFLQHRPVFEQLYLQSAALDAVLDRWRQVGELDSVAIAEQFGQHAPDPLQATRAAASDFTMCLQELQDLISTHQPDPSAINGPLIRILTENLASTTAQVDQLNRILIQRSKHSVGFMLTSEARCVNETHSKLLSIISGLEEHAARAPECQYLIQPCVIYLRTRCDLLVPMVASNRQPHVDVSEVRRQQAQLIDTMLVVLQKLSALRAAVDTEAAAKASDGSTLTTSVPAQLLQTRQRIAALQAQQVLDRVSEFERTLAQYAGLSPDQEDIRNAIAVVAPFLQMYQDVLCQQARCAYGWHRTMLKFCHIVGSTVAEVAEHGFCQSGDEEAVDGSSENATQAEGADGTGIGAGQGDKDVSDQIESADQVEGLQGEEQAETEPQSEKDKQKGVELEDDFDGQVEDAEDEENVQSDEENPQDDSTEDATGTVDPLSETAVDEKFWSAPEPEQQPAESQKPSQGQKDSSSENLDGQKDPDATHDQSEHDKSAEKADLPEETSAASPIANESPPTASEPVDAHAPEMSTLDLPDDMDLDEQEQNNDEEENASPPDLPHNDDAASAEDGVAGK